MALGHLRRLTRGLRRYHPAEAQQALTPVQSLVDLSLEETLKALPLNR